jgi:hypothetical protein
MRWAAWVGGSSWALPLFASGRVSQSKGFYPFSYRRLSLWPLMLRIIGRTMLTILPVPQRCRH